MPQACRHLIIAALMPCALYAQAPATSAPRLDCGREDNRLLRGVMGGAAGAIVGLVAVNIRYSDWSDHRPGNLGRIRLSAGLVGGLVGASLGNVMTAPCAAGPRASTSRARGMYASITADEIARSGITGSVYELVYSLRRQWLNTRGVEMSETPQLIGDPRTGVVVTPADPTIMVYLDHGSMGDMMILKSIPIAGVVTVKYYNAAEATQKWGNGHNHGAIQVLTSASDTR